MSRQRTFLHNLIHERNFIHSMIVKTGFESHYYDDVAFARKFNVWEILKNVLYGFS